MDRSPARRSSMSPAFGRALALACALLVPAAASANGFALHAYGWPGVDISCSNGWASWACCGSATGTVGNGVDYTYHDVSGDVVITAHPTDPNLAVSWSSRDRSWHVVSGCTAGSATCTVTDGNYVDANFGEPAPTLGAITPSSALVGSAALTITATSPDNMFTHQSVVRFDGYDLATTFVSTGELSAVVPVARLATTGAFQVAVRNPTMASFGPLCGSGAGYGSCPALNGGDSAFKPFTVVPIPPDAGEPDASPAGLDAAEPGLDAETPTGLDAEAPTGLDAETPTDLDAESPTADASTIEQDGAQVAVDGGAPADAASETEDVGAVEADGSAVRPSYRLGGCGCGGEGGAVSLAAAGALALVLSALRRARLKSDS